MFHPRGGLCVCYCLLWAHIVKYLFMTEQFRGLPPEEPLVTGLPDVKFFGFGNEVLPYRVGFDVDAYKQLLKDSLNLSPYDISRISIRFLGLIPADEFGSAQDDFESLQEESEEKLVRAVSLGSELMAIFQQTGVMLANAEPESAIELIRNLLAAKLAFESFSIKDELLHKKLSRKPSAQIVGILDRPLVYFYGLGLEEYLLQNLNWLPRTLILINSFLLAKIGAIKIKGRLVNSHNSLHERLDIEENEALKLSETGEINPEIIEEWVNLIKVYPTKTNGVE